VVRARGFLGVLILPVVVALVPVPPRVGAADPAPPAEPAPLKIGLPENMFSAVPPAVVQIAAKPFQTMFEQQTKLKGVIEVNRDYREITEKLRTGKLDIAVYNGFEYAWVKQHPELVPLVIASPTQRLQTCLVVNVKSKAMAPADLKGECVTIPGSTKAFSHLYMERLKAKLPAGRCCPAKEHPQTSDEALDALTTNENTAVLVDAGALLAYQKNKPGPGTQLRILCESEPFPPGVVVYRKDAFNAQTAANVRCGLTKGMNTSHGQLLAGLWRLDGFKEPNDTYQTELDKCLKAYPPPERK
jgi:ABC-type phosphate/phosphonate transport system substrate-binding protein